jgi:predicted MFS family arabinose efflux permease
MDRGARCLPLGSMQLGAVGSTTIPSRRLSSNDRADTDGLNSACSYFGMSLGGVIGALGIRMVGAHYLGLIGAVLAVIALILAELANLRISASSFALQEIPNESKVV